MRTLVISDLHLGSRHRRDVLRRPEALGALLDALEGIDRLVLLGDVVELQEGRQRAALAVAAPVLRAIGSRLGPGAQAVLVPGNHDDALVVPWLRREGWPATIDGRVPLDATAVLAQLAAWLAPAAVEVRYPGLWLSDRVWATHGHYLDDHLLPHSAFGVPRGRLRGRARDHATAADYERRRWAGRTGRRERTQPRDASGAMNLVLRVLRAATLPGPSDRPLGHHLAPITRRLLDAQMRHAALPAMGRVAGRLGIDADWIVFGHVHRSGPSTDDDASRWRVPSDGPRLVNAGSWVYEPLLLHRARAGRPYWPGTGVLLDGDDPPRPVALLRELELR